MHTTPTPFAMRAACLAALATCAALPALALQTDSATAGTLG